METSKLSWADSTLKKDDSKDYDDSEDEVNKMKTLFQPIFEAYIESIFKTVEGQILEALAKTTFLDNLKAGLLKNISGKTLWITRETIKSMEKISVIQIGASKYPIFFSFSKEDEKIVAEFLTGDQGEEENLID